MKYLILFGPPGAGKGTVAGKIERVVIVSTGDLFRDHLKRNSDLGQQARVYMDNGELVPDNITIAMLQERLKQDDCQQAELIILDGFPRTIAQAEALIENFPDAEIMTIYLSVNDDIIVNRLIGRWTCPKCKRTYNTNLHAAIIKSGNCVTENCKTPLERRPDDESEEKIRTRLRVYHTETRPVLKFLREKKITVKRVIGNKPPETVLKNVKKALG